MLGFLVKRYSLFTCAESGQVYGWGGNSYSQVGLASSSSVQVPTLVGGALSGKTVTKIACGGNHSLALISTGEASQPFVFYSVNLLHILNSMCSR